MSTGPPSLKSLAIQNINRPVVIRGFITKWNLLNWSLDDWASKFGDKVLPFRVGSINEATIHGQPVWERSCPTEFMTFKEFLNWDSGMDGQIRNKWMYFDYKYMHEWFGDDPDFLKAIDWGCLGFHGRSGRESTLWIGCQGAHTPCHADTYGFNLVAQLHGRKRWLLFPPDSKQLLLRASRIPYEESSIYVKGCVGGGQGGARGIVLSAGEVLLVPRRWWHRVDTEEGISISINTWVPSEHDNIARVEESLVRFLFASTVESLPLELQKSFLNPNEDDLPTVPLAENLSIVRQSVQVCTSHLQQINNLQSSSNQPHLNLPQSPPIKRMKHSLGQENLLRVEGPEQQSLHMVPMVGKEGWSSWHPNSAPSLDTSSQEHDDTEILQRILNAFCHPEVISLVCQKMLEISVKSDNLGEISPEEMEPRN